MIRAFIGRTLVKSLPYDVCGFGFDWFNFLIFPYLILLSTIYHWLIRLTCLYQSFFLFFLPIVSSVLFAEV